MADQFTDERGVIKDILTGPIDCVTEIYTREGSIRGNHLHEKTHQWTYVVSGKLLVVTADKDGRHERVYGPGEMAHEAPSVAHAWRALEDVTALVFTRGPRSGSDYESDTQRLDVPLIVQQERE